MNQIDLDFVAGFVLIMSESSYPDKISISFLNDGAAINQLGNFINYWEYVKIDDKIFLFNTDSKGIIHKIDISLAYDIGSYRKYVNNTYHNLALLKIKKKTNLNINGKLYNKTYIKLFNEILQEEELDYDEDPDDLPVKDIFKELKIDENYVKKFTESNIRFKIDLNYLDHNDLKELFGKNILYRSKLKNYIRCNFRDSHLNNKK